MATIVSTPAELDAVRAALSADYELGNDIDMSSCEDVVLTVQGFVIDGDIGGQNLIGSEVRGITANSSGVVYNQDGNNIVVVVYPLHNPFVVGDDLDLPLIGTTVSFGAAPYDGVVKDTFMPIGMTPTGYDTFTGSFDGKGFKITNMTVNLGRANCGLIAFNAGEIRYVDITGDVTAGFTAGAVGNGILAGLNGGTIYRCITRGSVTSTGAHLAGVVGYNTRGTVDECVNRAAVYGSSAHSGGICGRCDYGTTEKPGIIRNCYNAGTVTSTSSGGIVGRASSSAVRIAQITNCHNIGTIVGSPDGGGIYGEKGDGATFVGCKYLSDTHVAEADGVEGLTSAQMKDVSNFVGWDFSDVWYMGDDYPQLQVFGGMKSNRFRTSRFSAIGRITNRFYYNRYS